MEKPKHPKARSLATFFCGLNTFSDLESRIASLPTEKERGDAFEVFAEAYLATQPIAQAKQVWPFDVIPPTLKQSLGLRGRDMGVDGLIETRVGQFHAYQVKFRSEHKPLNWGNDLATFFGLSDRCDQRLLFTNSNDVSEVTKQRKDFYCIRGSDLDHLEARDFDAIARWLEGATVTAKKKEPLPHQREALANILPALKKHDRVTSIMACGTGKTLVALWVAENVGHFCEVANKKTADSQSRPTNILLLVPSLALLRQTLHEWLKETRWPKLSYLCVCSDPTVDKGTDELIVRQSDLDFPVTTDSKEVRKFLAQKSGGVKIIFSTYQSAHVVGRACPPEAGKTSRGDFAFDLGIFDEAHKTAGREGASFGFALSDKNLLIRKRLFLTATPRHYDIQRRDKEGDAKLVYSMDVPEVFGPVAHTLTFAEAARRRIICNYKVIISVVTSDMINDELLRRGKVLVKGNEIHARQVANQLALKAAVEKHDVRKIFTFHRSVASAKSFVAPVAAGDDSGRPRSPCAATTNGEGIANHLPDFACFHVNGSMPPPTVKV